MEEQFYLFWPFAVLWLERRTLLGICVGCYAGALAVRWALLLAGANPAIAVQRLTPCQLDSLAVGAFIALLLRDGTGWMDDRPWQHTARRTLAGSALVAALMAMLFPEWIEGHPLLVALYNSCLAVFFGAALFCTVTGSPAGLLRKFLETKALQSIGKYSYGLYVFHWPLGRLTFSFLEAQRAGHPGSWLDRAVVFRAGYLLASIALSLTVAWLSWHLYEKHFLRLKRYFDSR